MLVLRELRIRFGCWLLGDWLPYIVRGKNEIGCTVYVIMCEDRETYQQNFNVTPRYHVDAEHVN